MELLVTSRSVCFRKLLFYHRDGKICQRPAEIATLWDTFVLLEDGSAVYTLAVSSQFIFMVLGVLNLMQPVLVNRGIITVKSFEVVTRYESLIAAIYVHF